jgi:M6 family metalloprotease-like protein
LVNFLKEKKMKRKNKQLTILYISLSIIFLFCVSIVNTLSALEPPDPKEKQKLIETKDLSTRLEFVKKLGNHKVDSYLLKRALNRAERKFLEFQGMKREEIDIRAPRMAPPPAWQGMPSKGNVKVFALLIEFNDMTHANTRDFIHNNLFGAGDPARSPYESLAVYYNRSSYNQLNLGNGNTLGWYQTTYKRSSVPQTPAGRENLIKEALNHFKAQGHDFSQYDNNGDGVIDYFIVIWTGPDNGWGKFWWGYQENFTDSSYKLDNKELGKYSWQWETRPTGGIFTPVVVIHETGHALGLPDYYDYDVEVGPRGGVGGLDIMDSGKGDDNCFSKWLLEWVAPVYIFGGTQKLSIEASGTSQNCVLIWPPTAPNVFSEFFMVQNRDRVGNDNAPGMPGDGMLIWHVDGTLNANGTDFLYNNSFTRHKLLRLMEADGKEEIEAGLPADADDYYKAGNEFGPRTKPSSVKYDGTATGIEISQFSAPGRSMSAKFGK